MQWIITQDCLAEPGERSDVGRGHVADPGLVARIRASAPDALDALLLEFVATLPYEFRLKDDDDEVYYQGACGDLDQADQEQAFEPLDWALAMAGCTSMEYRKRGESKWQVL